MEILKSNFEKLKIKYFHSNREEKLQNIKFAPNTSLNRTKTF